MSRCFAFAYIKKSHRLFYYNELSFLPYKQQGTTRTWQKIRRLFKVAKELNVATNVLVEHLAQEGYSIEDSPNSKIPGEMYEILLREFASDKQMREKANELIEKRNEDRLNLLHKQDVVTPETRQKRSRTGTGNSVRRTASRKSPQ